MGGRDGKVEQPQPREPRTAQWNTFESLKEDMRYERHASDGAGRAWLELPDGEDGSVLAGTAGSWTIVFEAGPLGVAEGGGVYLQVSPFWRWSTPQPEYEDRAGFTRVSTEAKGVELKATTLDKQLMGIEVLGAPLEPGERVRIEYGAGPLGARADSYAEADSRFWIGVDGDGDGVRGVIVDSPGVRVHPGPPAGLVVTISSTARVGERVRVCVAVLDAVADMGPGFEGRVEFVDPPAGLALPESVELEPEDGARKSIEVEVTEAGLYRVRARAVQNADGQRAFEAESNPLLVGDGPRIYWADLHGHSAMSDGTGSPEDYYLYARDVASLDVAALTDHDHWGILFMDQHPQMWEENKAVTRRFDEPGRFVTLFGYEWTNWVHGHRHVLYFSEEAPLLSSMDDRYDTPTELWDALRGLAAITVPHHPAGGPVAVDWSFEPDPILDPCTEITSAHGCSEASDCPLMIYSPAPGHFARDALELGYPIGFVASGDGHDGHPGLTHLSPDYPTGGLTALLTDDLSREGVLQALRGHRVYATNGPRILLRTSVGTARMGSTARAGELGPEAMLFVQAHGTAAIEGVEVIRSGQVIAGLGGDGGRDFATAVTLTDLSPGEYVYVRVSQAGGGMAWSSPIFVE